VIEPSIAETRKKIFYSWSLSTSLSVGLLQWRPVGSNSKSSKDQKPMFRTVCTCDYGKQVRLRQKSCQDESCGASCTVLHRGQNRGLTPSLVTEERHIRCRNIFNEKVFLVGLLSCPSS
jgi:hypothetical protein